MASENWHDCSPSSPSSSTLLEPSEDTKLDDPDSLSVSSVPLPTSLLFLTTAKSEARTRAQARESTAAVAASALTRFRSIARSAGCSSDAERRTNRLTEAPSDVTLVPLGDESSETDREKARELPALLPPPAQPRKLDGVIAPPPPPYRSVLEGSSREATSRARRTRLGVTAAAGASAS